MYAAYNPRSRSQHMVGLRNSECRKLSSSCRASVVCRLTPNPAFEKEDRAFDAPEPARYMCPVTLKEMNGSQAFVVLKTTGWVMAEKATKEVGIEGLQVSVLNSILCSVLPENDRTCSSTSPVVVVVGWG